MYILVFLQFVLTLTTRISCFGCFVTSSTVVNPFVVIALTIVPLSHHYNHKLFHHQACLLLKFHFLLRLYEAVTLVYSPSSDSCFSSYYKILNHHLYHHIKRHLPLDHHLDRLFVNIIYTVKDFDTVYSFIFNDLSCTI